MHTQSLRCHNVCIYTHILHNRATLVWGSSQCRVPRKSFREPPIPQPCLRLKFSSLEPCSYRKVSDCSQKIQEKRSKMSRSECHQISTLTQNLGWGLLLCPATPKQGTVNQPHYVEMSSEGVMSSEKTSNCTGLRPIKGQ